LPFGEGVNVFEKGRASNVLAALPRLFGVAVHGAGDSPAALTSTALLLISSRM
jgi:hypothetical protein